MSPAEVHSLPAWGSRARETFLASWALVPVISILNHLHAINSRSGVGLIVSVIVATVWTISGLSWAMAEYWRRH